eukprot:Seg1381.4 transcript_id=Seg1381.4/GoldUCD/mRNA.D3Y31 product="hypothetical protein" protein_id=Seg1381.4/GoldUCD/D3Y31
MRDQLTELSVVLFSLQQEMAANKARMDQKEKQIENFEKEQYEETKNCLEKVLVVREILDRTISKLENDFQMYKLKAEQTKVSFEEDKADLLKRIETQENASKELTTALKNLEKQSVNIDSFNAMKSTVSILKDMREKGKDELKPVIRKLVNEKYADWDKEATDLLMKFDELKKSTVELRTIANVHERGILDVTKRINAFDGHSILSQMSCNEVNAPTPSLPKIERMKSVHSEALSLSNRNTSKELVVKSYEVPKSNVASRMRAMNAELKESFQRQKPVSQISLESVTTE